MDSSKVEQGQSGQGKDVISPLSKAELLIKMEELKTPLGLRMSDNVYDFLQQSFSIFTERSFLLYEKDGIITKAIESTYFNTPNSFYFYPQQILETNKIMENEGYSYIGNYHHHLDSDEQIAARKNPPPGKEYLKLGPNYDPLHLSPDDAGGGFNATNTYSPEITEEERLELKKICASVNYLLLGHFSKLNNYRLAAYSSLKCFSQNHPWNVYKEQLQLNGFMLNHYKSFKHIVNHPIEIVETEDNDPEAISIFKKYIMKNKKYEGEFLDSGIDYSIKVFTKNGIIDYVETINNNQMIRYVIDSNGLVSMVTTYGDNTTRGIKANIDWFNNKNAPDRIKEAQINFNNKIMPQVKRIMSNKIFMFS